jgi:hypothetical protein
MQNLVNEFKTVQNLKNLIPQITETTLFTCLSKKDSLEAYIEAINLQKTPIHNIDLYKMFNKKNI